MEKITGIKSVDFKVKAVGHGVVNWNGPTNLAQEDGSTVDNHSLPKLRGYTNLSGKVKDTGYKYRKEPTDIDFKKTPLYISQNCIRHHLFREQAYDLHFVNEKNLQKVISSATGLIRGYVVPASQSKRTSPLLLEDFVDQLGNGNFEQMGRSGTKDGGVDQDGKEKKSNSFFSKTTFGNTEYISYGSLSIEQLQFISLDDKFERQAIKLNGGKSQGEEIANDIEVYLKSLSPESKPIAKFDNNYVRRGSIFEEGETGILLNNDAIHILVNFTLDKISELSIRQAKSYMYVDSILIDYNDSSKMMRIKRNESEISEQPKSDYAVYFEAK
jgi:hypothetical protein